MGMLMMPKAGKFLQTQVASSDLQNLRGEGLMVIRNRLESSWMVTIRSPFTLYPPVVPSPVMKIPTCPVLFPLTTSSSSSSKTVQFIKHSSQRSTWSLYIAYFACFQPNRTEFPLLLEPREQNCRGYWVASCLSKWSKAPKPKYYLFAMAPTQSLGHVIVSESYDVGVLWLEFLTSSFLSHRSEVGVCQIWFVCGAPSEDSSTSPFCFSPIILFHFSTSCIKSGKKKQTGQSPGYFFPSRSFTIEYFPLNSLATSPCFHQ